MNLLESINSQVSNKARAFPKTWSGPWEIRVKQEKLMSAYADKVDISDLDEFNSEVRSWGAEIRAILPGSLTNFNVRGTSLRRSIKDKYGYDYGDFRIGIAFRKEGIFVHKGVGRGYVMQGGSVVKTSKTQGFNRVAKEWFNPVIESKIGDLEKIIHSYIGSAIVKSSRIYIR